MIGERIKEQARQEAEFKRAQATQQAQASTSQGMSNDEAYAMYMASGGRSGSYARALGAAYVPTYSGGGSTASYDVGGMQGISPEFGGYAGGDASDTYAARVVRAGVGIAETLGAGAYNGVVRIAGGVASVPYAIAGGADAGVAVQEGFKERFGYTTQSAGARDVAQVLAPVGAAISSASSTVRNFSESYIGDTATTIVGGVLRRGWRLRGLWPGLRGVQSLVEGANVGLRTSTVISNSRAESFLLKQGMSADRAADFVASFDGPITARMARSGEDFLRYTDVADSKGSFLTKTAFANPASAVDGLYLGPYGDSASLMQPVTSVSRSIVLEGAVAKGGAGIMQTLIVNRNAFHIGTGVRY